ncbi:asparagine synthase (glutamine-hydrolyzing) [Aliikangiella sp. IMCC44359]|uniref:asparagine synthase (glutamine-hydrolyzing) n=1 Tax=Aliikangiella sp. IMCC44359 TaxID=3459125 RepID=UPI00403B1B07
MCGIAGAVTYKGEGFPSPDVADKMCQVIEHRGPDHQGMYYSEPAFLGMRRLSIIDLSTGEQPIHNEDGSIQLVFNGEIYNYKSLREELKSKGYQFYTNGDTECILRCYQEYGEDCFKYLRGMFGVAIWDSKKQKLVLGRDPLGKKPLFYTYSSGTLYFGSELKSLLVNQNINKEVDHRSTFDYLLYGYVPTPRSIFTTIDKLPPGHSLTFQNGKVELQQYWKLDYSKKLNLSDEELKEKVFQTLDESVALRLGSDVPFGAFLSGGLDSSVVVALMAKHMDRPVKTFSIGFKENQFNELGDARMIAEHVQSEHHEFIVEANAVDMLDKLVWHFDEPFADSSAIPTYLVSEMAAKHVKMVLSGDGGDEAFGGYDRYFKYLSLHNMNRYSLGLASPAAKLAGGVLGDKGKRLKWVSKRLAQKYPENYLSGVALSTPEFANTMLNQKLTNGVDYGRVAQLFSDYQYPEVLDRIKAGDIGSYLLDDVLVKVDRTSMACSLEVRSPLLDVRLIELAAQLPMSMNIKQNKGKQVLRQIAEDLLPMESLNKKKQGFAIPLADWFRTSLKDMMLDLCQSSSFINRGIFDAKVIENITQMHIKGEHDYSENLWQVLCYELWARKFLD